MKTYYREYRLLKDTPDYKAGWPLKWDGIRRKYYFSKVCNWGHNRGQPDYELDYGGQSFTLEKVESMPDWFKPTGQPAPFIPLFPSRDKISEYVGLNFENHLVDDVDICRALTDVWEDRQFRVNLYEFVKGEYERVHNLNLEAK